MVRYIASRYFIVCDIGTKRIYITLCKNASTVYIIIYVRVVVYYDDDGDQDGHVNSLRSTANINCVARIIILYSLAYNRLFTETCPQTHCFPTPHSPRSSSCSSDSSSSSRSQCSENTANVIYILYITYYTVV